MTVTLSGKATDLLDCIAWYRDARANMRPILGRPGWYDPERLAAVATMHKAIAAAPTRQKK